MKKSKLVTLGVLTIAALAAIGCDDDQPTEEVRHCVSPDGVVVEESMCNGLGDDAGDAGVVQSTDDAGNVIYVPRTYIGPNPILFYRWYYGGYSRPLMPGTRIIINGNGYGRFTPSVGHVYSTPSTFGRGGFGATGRGFSGGGGVGHGGGGGE